MLPGGAALLGNLRGEASSSDPVQCGGAAALLRVRCRRLSSLTVSPVKEAHFVCLPPQSNPFARYPYLENTWHPSLGGGSNSSAQNRGLRLGGTASFPDCFTLCRKPARSEPEVMMIWWSQQSHIICPPDSSPTLQILGEKIWFKNSSKTRNVLAC